MDTPPELPAQPVAVPASAPQSFSLPWIAWIAWALYGVVSSVCFFVYSSPPSAYQFGQLIGHLIMTLIMSVLLALAAWRVTGREASAGRAVYFIVFALSVAGHFNGFWRTIQANATMAKIRREQASIVAEQRAALAKGEAPDQTKALQLVEKASAELGRMADNSSGRQRQIVEIQRVYLAEMLVAKKRYDEAVKGLQLDSFWDLAKFTPGEPAEARRQAVKAFLQASGDLRPYTDVKGTAMARIIRQLQASPRDARDIMAGYQANAKRLALTERLRTAEAQLTELMGEFIDFAEQNEGRWRIEAGTGKVILANDDLLEQYHEIMDRVKVSEKEQLDLQKQQLALATGQTGQ